MFLDNVICFRIVLIAMNKLSVKLEQSSQKLSQSFRPYVSLFQIFHTMNEFN